MLAPKGAVCPLHFHGRANGVWVITWDMGKGKRKTTVQYGGPMSETLVQQMWNRMDNHLDHLVEASLRQDEDQITAWKIKCRELAEILALFMPPHFKTADAIAAEAQRRRDHRREGDTEYETPGLGTLRYTPPPGTRRNEVKPPPKKESSIDPELQGRIKDMIAKGVPKSSIAQVFNVSVNEIEAIL